MAAHAYWRVYATANGGGAYIQLRQIQFRPTAGAANPASGGTVLYGTQLDAGVPYYAASNAFDNGSLTAVALWSSTAGTTDWVGYHYATPIAVSEVAMMCYVNYFTGPSCAPKDFVVQYSDNGITWTAVSSFTGVTSWSTSDTTYHLFAVGAFPAYGQMLLCNI